MTNATAAVGSAAGEVLVVLNPVASRGGAPELRTAIEKYLADHHVAHRFVEFPSAEAARAGLPGLVRDAVLGGCERIVAVGGDGTVSLVAGVVARRNDAPPIATLAIVPAGTANVLAHELGIPADIDSAVAMAFGSSRTLDLDAMATPDRLVFTQLGIGPDAQVIGNTSREQQMRLGRLAYLATFLRRGSRLPTNWFDFEIDGTARRAHAWQIVVANAGTFGTPPFTWGPGIDPTDGVLDLCIFDARSFRGFLSVALRLLTNSHRRDGNTRFLRVHERLEIRSSRPLSIQGDGEILGRTPLSLRVVKGAIRVVVPREIEDIPAGTGVPGEPAARAGETAAAEAATAADGSTSVARDVDVMVAQHSRTWLLQGPLKHPFARLSALDAALFLRANALVLGPVGDRLLLALSDVMHFGEGWTAVALIMLIGNFRAGLHVSIEALVVLWMTMLTVNYPLKRLFRRRRPFNDFVKARVLGPRPTDFSLPSGHSAAAFAGAVIFGAHAPAWAPLFWLIAAAVGFSRVYLGVHYPSDVLFGGAFGAALAVFYAALMRMMIGPF